jgi:hypothetical protein
MPESTSHLGVNVYCWGQTEQNLLLVHCLAPFARELMSSLGSSCLWFDRFDARGPHIVAIFTVPTDAALEVETGLRRHLDAFLIDHPPSGAVNMKEAAQRHASCRGAYLSQLDRGSDLAPEGSYAFFRHSDDQYPFTLSTGMPLEVERRIWELLDDLSLWTIRQLAANPSAAPVRTAVLWLALFDQALNRLHPHPEDFWRFHASTLLFGLPRKLEENERQVIESLPAAVGKKNLQTFEEIWRDMERQSPCWPSIDHLLQCILTEAETTADSPWRLPREIVHWTLKHLCLYVASEIPLVLYAWHRNLK